MQTVRRHVVRATVRDTAVVIDTTTGKTVREFQHWIDAREYVETLETRYVVRPQDARGETFVVVDSTTGEVVDSLLLEQGAQNKADERNSGAVTA